MYSMWVSDLHFMVQWFLSYFLKTIWWINVVLEIMFQCDTNIKLKPYAGQWPIFHGPVILPYTLEDYLMDKCHNWNIGFMWCKDLPDKMYVGQWPTFHGPVIWSWRLLDGLMLYWWYSVWHKHWTETIYVGQWPIFHDPISWKLFNGQMS